jgi:hypothetical protein
LIPAALWLTTSRLRDQQTPSYIDDGDRGPSDPVFSVKTFTEAIAQSPRFL